MSEKEQRRAEERHGWWPGWIWSIPVAAVGLVIWLAVRSWTQTGPEVTVIFPVIADLRPGDTKVKFEDFAVGEVEDVQLEPDLKHMRAKLQLNTDMQNHLGDGTQFWIIGQSFSLAHLSDVKALVSGVSVGISPRPGKAQDTYQGLAQEPVLQFGKTGEAFTLHMNELGSVKRGTPVFYLGERVGEIKDYRMTGDRGFEATAIVNAPYDRMVHANSRFWRAGPVHLSSDGTGPTVQFQSVPALFEGAIDFETPDEAPGPVAAKGQNFPLYEDQDAARNAPGGQGVTYRAVFHDASGVPGRYAPVTLMGKRVGAVADATLEYDPANQQMQVAATIVLDPQLLKRADGTPWTDPRGQMDDMLRHLVAQGLRAELAASPPVIGGQQVSLRIVPGTRGNLGAGPVPEIPTSGGGGVAGIMAGVNDVVEKVNEMPLPQIADNLREISRQIAQLTSSPALQSTLQQVDRSTANLQRITHEMDRQLPPALDELRKTVAEARASLASAQDLLSARGAVANTPGSEGLPQTLYEITRTARALRELSDFLDRHPSSVLTGRAANE